MTFIKETELRIENKYIVNSNSLNKFLYEINKYGFIKIYPYRYINSLYYDDPLLSSVNENIAGITPRNKYRIRWYNDKSESRSFGWQFEKKIKKGELGYKKICKLKENFYKDKDFSYKNLVFNHKIISQLVNIKLEPKLICNYKRSYYEDIDGIRITIDSKLRFKNFSNKTNQKNSLWHYSNLNIIELKFKPNKRKKVTEMIKKFPINTSRCSKYLLAHSKLNGLQYI